MIYAKHVQPILLYKDILKKYPNFKDLDLDTLADVYKREDPIVRNKIYALHAIKNTDKDEISALFYLRIIAALADVLNNFIGLTELGLEAADVLYGLYQYTQLVGEPSSVNIDLTAALLWRDKYLKTSEPTLSFINPRIYKIASEPEKYIIDTWNNKHGVYTSVAQATDKILYDMLSNKKVYNKE